MKRVLFTAEPFAFGPSAKAVSIARALPNGLTVSFLGRGTAADFPGQNGFPVINYERAEWPDELTTLLHQQDLIVNVMNFEIDSRLAELRTPIIYVDTLFWFWNSNVWSKARPEVYFCQNFPGVAGAIQRSSAGFKERIELVGPIVDTRLRQKHSPGRHILLSFGGLESDCITIGRDSHYPHFVLDALLEPLLDLTDAPVIVTARRNVTEALSARFGPSHRVRFASLGQKQFLTCLAQSMCLLTVPGIETVYEAFLYGVPVFFLPPSLNSQLFQLEVYRKHGVADCYATWPSLLDGDDDLRKKEPEEQIRAILGIIRRDGGSTEFKESAAAQLRRFLAVLQQPAGLVEKQSQFVHDLGANGLEVIGSRILSVLSQRGSAR